MFEIEKKLKECCDIPIFHDDQYGTAVITLAGVINALKLVGKKSMMRRSLLPEQALQASLSTNR